MSWKQMTYWSVFLSMASLTSLFGMFHYYSKTQYWDFSGVQWLRLWAPNAGGLGSIPSLGTRSHILQLWVQVPQLKILHAHWRQKIPRATTKTQHSPLSPPPNHTPDCFLRFQLFIYLHQQAFLSVHQEDHCASYHQETQSRQQSGKDPFRANFLSIYKKNT